MPLPAVHDVQPFAVANRPPETPPAYTFSGSNGSTAIASMSPGPTPVALHRLPAVVVANTPSSVPAYSVVLLDAASASARTFVSVRPVARRCHEPPPFVDR